MVEYYTVTKKPIQVEIFPQKLLMPDTAEGLLNAIDSVAGVIRMMIQGSSLPMRVSCGPGTGVSVDHPDRRVINVSGQAFELNIKVGRIRVELEDKNAKEPLRKAVEQSLPFTFEFKEGFFLRNKASLTDYAKYGFISKNDESINLEDKRYLGLSDPKANPTDRICVLESNER